MDDENRTNETATLPDKPWQMKTDDSEIVSTPVRASVKDEAEEDLPPVSVETPRKKTGKDPQGELVVDLDYMMDYDQALSSLVLLDERMKRFRFFNIAIIIFLAVFCVYAFIVSLNVNYLWMMGLCLLFIPMITILPARRRKKTATEVARMKSRFQVKLYKGGRIFVPGKGVVPIRNDLRALSFEDEHVLLLDMSGKKSFSIPKAYLTKAEIDEVRKIFKENSRFREIKRKEEKTLDGKKDKV